MSEEKEAPEHSRAAVKRALKKQPVNDPIAAVKKAGLDAVDLVKGRQWQCQRGRRPTSGSGAAR